MRSSHHLTVILNVNNRSGCCAVGNTATLRHRTTAIPSECVEEGGDNQGTTSTPPARRRAPPTRQCWSGLSGRPSSGSCQQMRRPNGQNADGAHSSSAGFLQHQQEKARAQGKAAGLRQTCWLLKASVWWTAAMYPRREAPTSIGDPDGAQPRRSSTRRLVSMSEALAGARAGDVAALGMCDVCPGPGSFTFSAETLDVLQCVCARRCTHWCV